MGREIKRVALDFNWPLGQTWSGYQSPEDGTKDCLECTTNYSPTGYSRLGRAISKLAISNHLLPVDSEELDDNDRLFMKAIHEKTNAEARGRGTYQIGTTTDPRMLCYDLLRHLQMSLNLPERFFYCTICDGSGQQVVDAEQNRIAEEWLATEPPAGEGWQVWETVSEGSPITPVFATGEELAVFLSTVGSKWDQEAVARGWKSGLPSLEAARAFVKSGWVPSAVISDGVIHHDIQSAILQDS